MKLKVIAVAACLALATVACSSSVPDSTSTSTSNPTGDPATRTTTGVTDTEIKVSALGYKASYGEALTGAQARFKRENDAGGVFGRKIVLSDFTDDNQTPATDTQAATKIVEQDKPFAIVPVMTATFPAADYLQKAGVPFVGWGIVPDWCNKSAGFSLNGCTDPDLHTQVDDFGPAYAKMFDDGTVSGKTVALMAADSDSARKALDGFAKVWEYNDATVVLKDNSIPQAPVVVADYTPFAQKIMATNDGKGPDVVEMIAETVTGAGLSKKLRELGYTGKIVNFSLYDPRIASLSSDIYNQITFAAWEQTSVPAVAQMIQDVDAVDPSATKGLAMAAGYWSADLFIDILKKTGQDLTRERFIAAGNDDFNYDGKGGTTDLAFPLNHVEDSAAISLVYGNGSGYDVVVPFTPLPRVPKEKIDG